MSLSKQLYTIISFIFLIIFVGNFMISVKNTKEYLQTEATTKAQDTATSLGMSLKGLMKNKNDAEIQSIIDAIANRGFYKEIRLENAFFTISKEQLVKNVDNKLVNDTYKIINVTIDKKIGVLEEESEDLKLMEKLEAMEKNSTLDIKEGNSKGYIFIPNKKNLNIKSIKVKFNAIKGKKSIKTFSIIKLNKTIAKVTRNEKFNYIPQWFIDLIPIKLKEMKSEISDAWKTTAIIYVSANAGNAYAKLYEEAKSALIYALVAFIISMLMLFIFIQYLLKPLKAIEKLAQSIALGNFKTIKKLPWTTEIKNVALSMNEMSTKIEQIVSKLNKNLENLTHKLSKDELTKLNIKQTFETDMKKMFISKSNGFIFTIKIDNLGEFAKTHTNEEVNEFIKNFANILKKCKIKEQTKVLAYRFYGSQFALIADKIDFDGAKELTKIIKKDFETLAKDLNEVSIAHIGAAPFNPISTTKQMLLAANEAYEKAKLIGPNEAFIRNNDDLVRDMSEWRALVFDIINNQKFDIDYIGEAKILSGKNEGKTAMKEAFTKAYDLNNNHIPIGTFVSIAEQCEKIVDFDKAVISKIIDNIKTQGVKYSISINLSFDSINNYDFIIWLKQTLNKHKNITEQLVFSLTAYAITKDIVKFKTFVDTIHNLNAKIIIKRFESKFIPLDDIKDLNLDYIRLARDYTNDISNDLSKQSFVEAMVELTHLLNIKLFAEDVKNEKDFNKIKELKVYSASNLSSTKS